MSAHRSVASPPLAGDDKIDAPLAALAADQPRMSVGDGHLGSVALGHLDRVWLDLVLAIETPDDQRAVFFVREVAARS
jgi:hypothetical protein